MAINPMHQFNVYRIGPEIKLGEVDISFTNAGLFMVISSITILLIFNFGSKKNSLIPSKIQLLAELSYSFISKMINDTAGSKAKPYFSFIFSLFMFVLFCNMFGMMPYSFTVTSHIIVTFVLAAFIFIGVTIIGFIKHGFSLFKIICSKWSAYNFIALNRSNRNYFLFKSTDKSIGSIVCKYDGWTYYDESIRRICCGAWNSWRMASSKFYSCLNWFGDISCFSSSICFCNFNLHLLKRCIKFTPLTI